MVVVAEVTTCHKKLQVVGVCLGGLHSNSSGQDSNQGKALPVQEEVTIEDTRDVKTMYPYKLEINY